MLNKVAVLYNYIMYFLNRTDCCFKNITNFLYATAAGTLSQNMYIFSCQLGHECDELWISDNSLDTWVLASLISSSDTFKTVANFFLVLSMNMFQFPCTITLLSD